MAFMQRSSKSSLRKVALVYRAEDIRKAKKMPLGLSTDSILRHARTFQFQGRESDYWVTGNRMVFIILEYYVSYMRTTCQW